MSEIYFPPLEHGARVVTDVEVNASDDGYGGACDIVTVLVPPGDGVATEAAIRRALHVQGQGA